MFSRFLTSRLSQAVSATHPALHPLLYTNVIITGGVASCPGFSTRFQSDLRPLVPDTYDLEVFSPPNPALTSWEGMSLLVSSGDFSRVAMTKAQYEESGGFAARMGR